MKPKADGFDPKHTIPCPGKCGHPHVAKTGPCTKTGCGCTARKGK